MPAQRTSVFGLRARLALAMIASCAFAATGSAAIRYAGVGGSGGPSCPIATPCTIAAAMSGAVTGDTVHVLPGTHATTFVSTQATAANVTIEGEGAGVSTISLAPTAGNPAVFLDGATPTMRNLTVLGSANTSVLITGLFGVSSGPVFDHVVLRNSGTAEAVIATGGATIRDSIIGAAGASRAVQLDGTMTGTTVVAATGVAVEVNGDHAPDQSANAIIRNSILRGGGATDITVIVPPFINRSSHLDIDYSAYRQSGIALTGPATQAIGTHNVFTAPMLVNITGATDVHQLAASPTIDAGDPAAAAGSTGDMDGDSRIIGSAPDIGADEALTKPAVAMGAVSNVTTTSATLNGTVNPAGLQTTYRFEYGPTVAYGSSSPDVVVPAGFTTSAATFDVTGLAAGATFHTRLVATNSAGTATSADQAVALTSPPPPPPPPPPADDPVPVVGALTLVPTAPKTGRRVTVRFSLSEQAAVTLTIDRLLPGRKKGTACKVGATTGVRCTKVVRRATLAATVAAGSASTFTIPAKPGGSKLAPGRYRLRLVARDLVTGKLSEARTAILVVRV